MLPFILLYIFSLKVKRTEGLPTFTGHLTFNNQRIEVQE